MNKNLPVKIFLALCVMMIASFARAQDNPFEQEFTILKNTSLSATFESNPTPFIIDYPSESYDSLKLNHQSGINYEFYYAPEQDYTGTQDVILQFRGSGPFPPLWPVLYTRFKVHVVPSYVEALPDFMEAELNGSPIEIYPLVNDSTSLGDINLSELALIKGGTAFKTDSNTVWFTPDADFEGMAYVQYVIEDSIGTSHSTNISIQVQDSGNIDDTGVYHVSASYGKPATIMLPLNGFEIDPSEPADLGGVEFILPNVIEYRPSEGASGLDTVFLEQTTEAITRTIIAQIISIDDPNGFVVDDEIFTPKATPVTFDVLANDIKKNFDIIDYSSHPDLVLDSNGVFTYTPPFWFSGVKEFYYTVDHITYSETGIIKIVVNDQVPDNSVVYNLKTNKNTPLIINYESPLTDFDFGVLSNPSDGQISYYAGQQTVSFDCNNVDGYNMVEYMPDDNFIGSDYFELEYCPSTNPCQIIKINVEVLDIYPDSVCVCLEDCVWAGDANRDGEVSVHDLLSLGYHMGATGPSRVDSSNTWFGHACDDWGVTQNLNGKDLKHIDSDGDGVITESDLGAIDTHFSESHSIATPQQLAIKDFPFDLDILVDSVNAGDVLEIYISIGNEAYPVENLNGLAFGIYIPPSIIDSASANFNYVKDGWFDNNSATLDIFKQPAEGNLQTAVTRTYGSGVSGYGLVSVLDFIVEEDLHGLGLDQEFIPVTISLEGGVGFDERGKQVQLPSASIVVNVDIRENQKPDPVTEDNLLVYPNPSQGLFEVHQNGGHLIHDIEVYSLEGHRVLSKSVADQKHSQIDLRDLSSGIYILKVETSGGPVIEKIQIAK